MRSRSAGNAAQQQQQEGTTPSTHVAVEMPRDAAAAAAAAAAAGIPLGTFMSISQWLDESSSDLVHGARHPDVSALLGRRRRTAPPQLLPLAAPPLASAAAAGAVQQQHGLRSVVSSPPMGTGARLGRLLQRNRVLTRGGSLERPAQYYDEEAPHSPGSSSAGGDDLNSPGSFARRWLQGKQRPAPPPAPATPQPPPAPAPRAAEMAERQAELYGCAAPPPRTGKLAAEAADAALRADAAAQAATGRHRGYYSLWQAAASGAADGAAAASAATAPDGELPVQRSISVPEASAPGALPVQRSVSAPAGPAGTQGRHRAYYNIWQSAAAALDASSGAAAGTAAAAAPPAGPIAADGSAASPPASRHTKYYSMWQAAAAQVSDVPPPQQQPEAQQGGSEQDAEQAPKAQSSALLPQCSRDEGNVLVVEGAAVRTSASDAAPDAPASSHLDVWQPRSARGWSIKAAAPLPRATSAPLGGGCGSSPRSSCNGSSVVDDLAHSISSCGPSSGGSCGASVAASSATGCESSASLRRVRWADAQAAAPDQTAAKQQQKGAHAGAAEQQLPA